MAGQIPLIPASLTLPPYPSSPSSPYPHQAVLALKHVGRILEVLRSKNNTGGGWVGWGESCVAWWARPEGVQQGGLRAVRQAWTHWAQEVSSQVIRTLVDEQNDWEDVPVIFVRAKELPKGALVEYQVNLHTGRHDTTQQEIRSEESEDDDGDEELEAEYRASGPSAGVYWEVCATRGRIRRGLRAAVFVQGKDIPLDLNARLMIKISRRLAFHLYQLTYWIELYRLKYIIECHFLRRVSLVPLRFVCKLTRSSLVVQRRIKRSW